VRPPSDHSVHDAVGTPMSAYDYGLPESAIAQEPVEPRSAARLLVGPGVAAGAARDAATRGAGTHATVADLPGLLRPGDVLVVNETRVLAARLALAKRTGGRAEVLLVEPLGPPATDGTSEWAALVRPGRRLPPGTRLVEAADDVDGDGPVGPPVVEVGDPLDDDPEGPGTRRVRLLDPTVVARAGSMPLPPYIHHALADPDRYQTVYAAERGLTARSAAAPTAGLHFTPDLLAACEAAGARIARVDLAIGLDTFRPVTAATAEDHVIHTERYHVPAATVAACASASRVVAVGTTAVRALESAAATGVLSGRTDLYIHGDFGFRVVDVLVTNFHLPRSSLLLLVEAFCGPVWRELYATALADGYRFLSFGDAMVVGRARPKGAPAWTVPTVPTVAR
jgi:S-adenosylmethionine:tRNA ribosyltransferase-isomerase